MNGEFAGNHIISLLNDGLDTGTMMQSAQDYYASAEELIMKDPEKALEHCERALRATESVRLAGSVVEKHYTIGKCHLLSGCINLNNKRNLDLAKEAFSSSAHGFRSQWIHLQSLASLGEAFAWRLLGNYKEAMHTCNRAEDLVRTRVMTGDIPNLAPLELAINEEWKRINDHFREPPPSPEDKQKKVTVFYFSTGQSLIAARSISDLNLLTKEDYEQNARGEQKTVTIDLEKLSQQARRVNYILEVDAGVDRVEDGLKKGDWLFISQQDKQTQLRAKRVAILVREDRQISAGLKTFARIDDHYVLRGQTKDATSLVIAPYESSEKLKKMSEYYEGYREISKKVAFEVQITGKVIEHISRNSIQDVTIDPIIWRIPILSDIGAGVDVILEDEVEDYCDFYDELEFAGAHFGVRVVGDSMKDHGILPEDIALIQQQKSLPDGEFGAVVIISRKPEHKSLGVLKRFHLRYENNDALRHVLLESGNPESKDLVVIEKGVDAKAIWRLCEKQRKTGEISNLIEYHPNAQIDIAGKCVGLLRKGDRGDIQIFHNINGRFQLYEK